MKMLVLNRKVGESITIDGQIKIKVLGDFGRVRIGIDAPKHMQIVRDEVIEKTQRVSKIEPNCIKERSNANTRSK